MNGKTNALSAQQAAALLGAHEETIRRLARRGAIPCFKLGKDWRFHQKALLRWSRSHAPRNQQPAARPVQQASASVPAAQPERRRDGSFPIVGIGASAGGLEALELFLRSLPDKCGMAFVIIQHLDPTRKGMMAELLQRATPMKVVQVRDRMRVEPDRVYVIPPNKDMSILHGVLHLLAPAARRGLRLPIDFFLRSLAADQRDRSIGVILSGMGSDGTLGLRAIKEQAGVVFVQAPSSAKFDGMPRSVVDAGLADVVAPVDELAGKVVAYQAHAPRAAQRDQPLGDKTQSAIEKVCVLLRSLTGHDFSLYKRSTVHRRIERRMALHQIDAIDGYVRYLQESSQEAALLFKELLIGVTSFFRDPYAWEYLSNNVLPALLAARPGGGTFRAWVTGCSTGEEAYSLAMVLIEAIEHVKPPRRHAVQIFATDLDKDAIDKARQGLYPANIAVDVSAERLRRFFVKDAHGYQVSRSIREAVTFAAQNLIMDPPFTRLDILSCRNLLIYLAPELQKRLLPLFHYSLNPDGILILGSAETIGAATDLFAPMSGKPRIYRKLDAAPRAEPVDFPASFFPGRLRDPEAAASQSATRQPAPNLQALSDRVLLSQYAPAAVLVNDKGDILYINGRTGKYLEPAAGKANWNIHAMAREGLRHALGAALQKALRRKRPVTLDSLQVSTDAGVQTVDVTVDPIQEPQALQGMVLIVFSDSVTPPERSRSAKPSKASASPAALARVQQELRRAREEMLSTREEMQTSQEELRSSNEELQSTNEELQSTNEELTTSKEEMQSLNEELQTVNQELQANVEELSRTNNDMRNLLDSTDIATLFLDGSLKIRRFTTTMSKLMKLIPGDVERPITDLAWDLAYPELCDDAREVLRTLVVQEKPITTNDGRWFSVRIMPYRTLENRIDGVVITFFDITVAKQLETSLRQTTAAAEART